MQCEQLLLKTQKHYRPFHQLCYCTAAVDYSPSLVIKEALPTETPLNIHARYRGAGSLAMRLYHNKYITQVKTVTSRDTYGNKQPCTQAWHCRDGLHVGTLGSAKLELALAKRKAIPARGSQKLIPASLKEILNPDICLREHFISGYAF